VSGTFGGYVLNQWDHLLHWNAQDIVHVVPPVVSIPPGTAYRLHAVRATPPNCHHNDIELANGVLHVGPATPGGVRMLMDWSTSNHCREQLVVGHSGTHVMGHRARVYLNDVNHDDNDGDGLGDALEVSLQTDPMNVDTDNDGLEDGWEVLGMGSSQRLPAWGADPRHKDAFVELDWNNALPGNPMNPAFALIAASPFLQGPVQNPNGQPGIRLHFDIGQSACDANGFGCSHIYGDWGGASSVTATDYVASGLQNMSPLRRGVFFHGLLLPGGNAASTDWKFRAGRGDDDLALIRNLVHALGLSFGGTRWGGSAFDLALDCKPSYSSVMNYAYASFWPLSFSDGSTPPIESTLLSEIANPGLDPARLAAGFGLAATSTEVDWNRDGQFWGSSISAVTRWSTAIPNCNVADVHSHVVDWDLHGGFRPAMVELPPIVAGVPPVEQVPRLNHFLYAKPNGVLYHTAGAALPVVCDENGDPLGCCPRTNNDGCLSWSSAGNSFVPAGGSTITTTSSPTATVERPWVSDGQEIFQGDPRVLFAYTKGTGKGRRFYVSHIGYNASLSLVSGPESLINLPLTSSLLPQLRDGTILWLKDGQWHAEIYLYYLGVSNDLRRARIAQENLVGDSYVLVDAAPLTYNGQPVASATAPAAAVHDGMPYIVTTTSTGELQLWQEASSTTDTLVAFPSAFPSQSTPAIPGRPAMMQHRTMYGGAHHLVYVNDGVLFGTWAPGTVISEFVPDGRMYNHRDIGVAAAVLGVSDYTDVRRLQMATACESCRLDVEDPMPMRFAPFAAGVYPFEETDHDDFATFATGLCRRLRATTGGCPACPSCLAGIEDDESLLP